MSTRKNLVKALARKYEAIIAEATATAEIYFDNSVGIGEHPQHIQELDKLVTKISKSDISSFSFIIIYLRAASCACNCFNVVFVCLICPCTCFLCACNCFL